MSVVVRARAERPPHPILLKLGSGNPSYSSSVAETMSAAVAESIEVARTRAIRLVSGEEAALYPQPGESELKATSYATQRVAAPPRGHVPGNIERPSRLPGHPATDFVVREAAYLDGRKGLRQNPSMPNWRCSRRRRRRDARITSGRTSRNRLA